MKAVEFHHGALCKSYEEQARKQGFTLGDSAKFADRIAFGLVAAHIHGCITEAEYDRILKRFQKYILIRNLRPIETDEEEE